MPGRGGQGKVKVECDWVAAVAGQGRPSLDQGGAWPSGGDRSEVEVEHGQAEATAAGRGGWDLWPRGQI